MRTLSLTRHSCKLKDVCPLPSPYTETPLPEPEACGLKFHIQKVQVKSPAREIHTACWDSFPSRLYQINSSPYHSALQSLQPSDVPTSLQCLSWSDSSLAVLDSQSLLKLDVFSPFEQDDAWAGNSQPALVTAEMSHGG